MKEIYRDGSHRALNPVFAQKEINSSPLQALYRAGAGQAAGLSNGVNYISFLRNSPTKPQNTIAMRFDHLPVDNIKAGGYTRIKSKYFG
jgi:hypothetical protein